MHSASLRFDLGDADVATAVLGALQPEIADGPPGSKATIALEGSTLVLEGSADDLSTLRALLNNAVRLLDAAQRTVT